MKFFGSFVFKDMKTVSSFSIEALYEQAADRKHQLYTFKKAYHHILLITRMKDRPTFTVTGYHHFQLT